jgi:hypothetical protein
MMQRREFLAHLMRTGVAGSAMLMRPLRGWAAPAAGTLHRVSVTDFGADPSGSKDSTEAVQHAIAALARRNARLVFPAGKYVFAASDAVVMDFRGFEGLEIFGNGGELFFGGASQPLRITQCRDLEVHDILIDWVRPPVSQGVVRSTTDHSVTVAVDAAFPVSGAEHIAALIGLDDAGGATVLSGPMVERGIGAVQLRGAQVLEVGLEHAPPFSDGMRIVLLHNLGSAPALGLAGCEQVLLETVQLHAAPANAISMMGCRDITLDTVAVLAHAGTGRLVSANGCGVEMLDCTGSVTVEHARLGGTGGPAMRIQQSYWRLAQIMEPQAVRVAGADGIPVPEWALPRPGAYLQLSEAGTLKLLGEIILTKAESAPGGMKLQFEETLSPAIGPGTLVCLSATEQPRLKMEDTQFLGGASSGLVAQSRVHIRGTRFANYAGPAVLLAPDLAGMRGPVVESVHIDDCHFERCELGGEAAALRGTITIDTALAAAPHGDPGGTGRVNQGITLQGNTFDGAGGPAIYCAGTSWLDVESNHFNNCDQRRPHGATPRAMVLRNLTDSTITLNDARANATIVMVDCTDKVKAVENGTLEIAGA